MQHFHDISTNKPYLHKTLILLTLILSLNLFTIQPAFASPQADVTNNQAVISFPVSVTFSAQINATANITSVVLEYGTEQLTCGEVVAKAFPQFTPGKSVNIEWTWEMRQSGSLPPGATIWWRWRYTDETGNENLSEQQTTTWLDAEHKWKTVSADKLNLHWYNGDQAFAKDLLNAAKNGLAFNETQSGLTANTPIDLYIYADTNDLINHSSQRVQSVIMPSPSLRLGSGHAPPQVHGSPTPSNAGSTPRLLARYHPLSQPLRRLCH